MRCSVQGFGFKVSETREMQRGIMMYPQTFIQSSEQSCLIRSDCPLHAFVYRVGEFSSKVYE
jgi:hypothetical protein